eukprot:Skav214479  [mRNA]  locus=scaffold1167:357858:360335:+ [translate_table: standard]
MRVISIGFLGALSRAGGWDVDVVVLGAGPSGLSTVQHLGSTGATVSVALLDKATRWGGRIRTLKYASPDGEVGVDVGPAWIHYGTANPLTYLAQQGNCSLIRTQNLNMEVYHEGKAVPRRVILEMFDLLDKVEGEYEQYKDANPANASLLLVLQQLFRDKKFNLSPEQQAAFAALLFGEVVEDWTAPLEELSAAKHCAYDNVDGVGSDWRVVEGMECVLRSMELPWNDLRPSLEVRLNQTAKVVKFDEAGVLVEGVEAGGANPWRISAKAAVIAVPLGELKEGEFANESDPDLFLQKIDLCSIEFTSPVSAAAPVLVAEADGRLAQKLRQLPDPEISDFLVSRLRKMFGSKGKLKRTVISRPWGLPFWHKNSKGRGSARMAGKPLDHRIFFAGDYVSHHVGTVASAYLSGIAAAHGALCALGHPGLDLPQHPAVLPMIRPSCAQKEVSRKGTCKVTLWDILYKCSALADLEDESGRTCFVQGHDQWQQSSGSWWYWLQSLLGGATKDEI